jgi:OmpA-OmpF porin, OOP family
MSLSDLAPDSKAPGYYQVPEAIPDDLDTDGDGFPDSIDACPTIKEDGKPPNPGDGCPADADRDGDGIPDIEDKCPDVPEDKDGIQDADGCPEDDADDDGVPDQKDACPLVPGFESEDPKQNGCPRKKHKRIVEEEGEIVLLEPIQFETARADIKAVSFPILDEVVSVMNDRPDVRIAVHGHTDSRGGHDYNVNLSQRRAASVVKYLTSKGINPKRLESEGFGPDKPIDSNDTEEGRAKNRRVEFKIIE